MSQKNVRGLLAAGGRTLSLFSSQAFGGAGSERDPMVGWKAFQNVIKQDTPSHEAQDQEHDDSTVAVIAVGLLFHRET